jgi:hypothetical protein
MPFPTNPGVYTYGLKPHVGLYPSVGLYPATNSMVVVPQPSIITVNTGASVRWDVQPPSYTSYVNLLKTNVRQAYFKVDLLRLEDETIYDTLISDIINADGSATNQLQEGIRRTCSFSLTNGLKEYTTFFNNISIGNKFKLSLGYLINNKIKWFSQGVYIFDNPVLTSVYSDRRVNVSGTDKWSMLNGKNGGILDGTYTAPIGSEIFGLIHSILNLNIVGDPVTPLIDSSLVGSTITYDITKQAGATVAELLLEIAYNLSCYVYYDEEGRFVMRPFEYDYNKAPVFSLNYLDYNYLGITKELSFDKIYNAVQVRADNIQDANTPIISEAINNDLTDPNSYPNYGVKKLYMVTDFTKGITSELLASLRANWELKNVKARQSSISASTLALYHINVNDVVDITDLTTNDNLAPYLIKGITLPIGTNVLSSVQLVKVTGLM